MDPAGHTAAAAADDAAPAATPEDKTTSSSSSTTTVVSPTAARSYECTFCKRGFSNAQALGGHMNIHRKDRAKLQQPPAHQFPFAVGYTTLPWAAAAARPSRNPRRLQPLFVDGPSSQREVKADRKMEHGPEQLDLELRLGPDAAAGPATGLKEFV